MSAWSWTVEKKNNYPVYSEEVFFFFHCIFSKLNLRDNVGRYLLTLILNMYHFYSSVSSCWVSHPFPFPPSMMHAAYSSLFYHVPRIIKLSTCSNHPNEPSGEPCVLHKENSPITINIGTY
uniref:Uncharacterized protein n=1 Tax=Cacopsylla melanoneura TaxID=428564 RepID=A0A8D8ZAA5_9HEMI